MSNLDYFVMFLGSCFTVLMIVLSFGKFISKKFKITLLNILIIVIAALIATINVYVSEGLIKIFISFMTLLLASISIYRENSPSSFINMIFCYLIMVFFEIVLSIIVANISDIDYFDRYIVLKILFSVVNVILVYLTCKIKILINFLNKLSNKIDKKTLYIIFILFFLSLIILDFKYIMTFSKNMYFSNLILMSSIIILVIVTMSNYIKANNKKQETETLLNFISKYEKIIDEDRINRHEMLNNLLFLKSFDDKNSSEYEQSLDELIKTYNKKGIGVKNIYKLPNGLKGIFYYKLSGLETEGFKLNINISNKLSNSFKKLPHNEYIILYKIVGILLDNAVEAAEKSKDKYIGIDIYNEKTNIVIIIDNSFKGKIDLNKINNKDYTSKGKNRGLGLFIVNKLLKESELIHLEQIIELNVFTSKIIIKKDK